MRQKVTRCSQGHARTSLLRSMNEPHCLYCLSQRGDIHAIRLAVPRPAVFLHIRQAYSFPGRSRDPNYSSGIKSLGPSFRALVKNSQFLIRTYSYVPRQSVLGKDKFLSHLHRVTDTFVGVKWRFNGAILVGLST